MPLYEYRCESCEKIHEVMQKFSDAPLSDCPDCQAPVTKLMSLSSFALKGSGWYSTDYKKSPSKSSAAPATASASASAPAATPAPAAPAASPPSTSQATKPG